MSLKEAKKYIVDALLKSHNKSIIWDDIYKYLINIYPKPTVSRAKAELIDEGIIREIKTVEGKKIILVREPIYGFGDDDNSIIDIIFEEVRDSLINYFKTEYLDNIINRDDFVVVDLEKLYRSGAILPEFFEYIVNHPEKTLNFIKECYGDAYYSLNNEELPEDFVLTVENIPDIFKVIKTIDEIRSKHIGKLVEFEGIISISSKVKSFIAKKCFVCQKCGHEWLADNDLFNPINVKKCPKCGGDVVINESKCINEDIQELKVQIPLELMKNPDDPPRYVTVILKNKVGIYAGRVKIVGIVKKVKTTRRKLDVHDFYIEGIYAKRVDGEYNIEISKEDEEIFKKLAKRDDVIDLLAERLIPEIEGHKLIKKAVFLQQIKGTKKRNKRNSIHILLIADPGVGKTVILRKISKIPGNLYASMTTATAVGLTAAVERERTEIGDNTWIVKPGVLVKANKGVACIDEFALKKDAHQAVLEAMESQTIHISKGGINAKLPSETSVLAACNPKHGRFDPDKSVFDQIDIHKPLLDRFDLIFPIKDISNEKNDTQIAEHIVDTAIYEAISESQNKEIEGYDYEFIEIDGKKVKINFDFIVKYILYTRQKSPIINKKAKEVIVNFYVEMRKKQHEISARLLDSVIRLAEAHAKARLKDVVDEEDAKEAINIIIECLKNVAYDPETGIFDMNKITYGTKSEREKLDKVLEIIKEISEEEEDGLAPYDKILDYCKDYGIDEKELDNILNKLIRLGDIDKPYSHKYRLI